MIETDKETFGAFVAKLRKEKGMTQKEISELLGLPRSTISNDICRMKEMLMAIDTRT